MTKVSVIIETYNAPHACDAGLARVLEALGRQTSCVREEFEVIVVVDESEAASFEPVRRAHPAAKFVAMKGGNYFPMKNYGLRFAAGEIIAFLDADCLPCRDWVQRIVATIEGGADVAVGRTRYPRGSLFSRTFDVFDFGHVRVDARGEASCFYANNVGFRRDVIMRRGFDRRLGRSGGCYLLSRRLKKRGYKFVYDTAQEVVHDFAVNRGLGFALERLRVGHDAVNLCRLDDEGVLPEKRFMRLGLLGPFAISAARVWSDTRRIIADRRPLGIRARAVPYFCAASVLLRGLEIVGGVVTAASPRYFSKRFGW